MTLRNILDKDIIELDLKAKTKDDVIRQLSLRLLETGYIDDIDTFIKDIYLRESEGITGMGNQIAIPHGKSSAVRKIGIAIGRTKKAVKWESYDDKPVNLIFLFCVSDDNDFATNHMKLLAELAGKLGNDERTLKLQKAKTKNTLLDLLCD